MKNLLLTLFFVSFSFLSTAQELKLDWVTQIGGSGDDQGYVIEMDQIGNIYTAGFFEDTVDFDPSSTTNNQISRGLTDIFIKKW